MKTKVPQLAKEVGQCRARILEGQSDLKTIMWSELPKLIPNFYQWFSGHFRPTGTIHKEPLFIGVAYTRTKQYDEGIKVVTLHRDGTLQIRPIREEEMGKDIGFKTGAEN